MTKINDSWMTYGGTSIDGSTRNPRRASITCIACISSIASWTRGACVGSTTRNTRGSGCARVASCTRVTRIASGAKNTQTRRPNYTSWTL
jgi:hypothetical protein